MDCDLGPSETDQLTAIPTAGTDLFTTRREDVFAGLGELEKKHSAFLKVLSKNGTMEDQGLVKSDPDEEEAGERSRAARDSSGLRSHRKPSSVLGDTRDSDYHKASRSRRHAEDERRRHSSKTNRHDPVFRRPQPRGFHRQRCPPIPDFKKHPEKYTSYSLGDVSENEMSERSNSEAAFAFLEERRLLREREERKMAGLPEEDVKFDIGSTACSQGLIAFSRPTAGRGSGSGTDASKGSDQGEEVRKFSNSSSTHASLSSSIGDDDEDEEDGSKSNESIQNSVSSTTPVGTLGRTSGNRIEFKSRKGSNAKRNICKKDNDDSD